MGILVDETKTMTKIITLTKKHWVARYIAYLVPCDFERHWSLFSTYWRYTNKIIIIIIIIYSSQDRCLTYSVKALKGNVSGQ